MEPTNVQISRLVLSKLNDKDERSLMAKLEEAAFGYFQDELCIPRQAVKNAYEDLHRLLRQFAELCRIQPFRAEKNFLELQIAKKKVLKDLLKKSLLFNTE